MKYSNEYKIKCIELYREGKWPETPEGISQREFRKAIRRWARAEENYGIEAVIHSKTNREWSIEEKYELVTKVLAGASCTSTAINAGMNISVLRRWVKIYKLKGYEGLATQRKGRPPKEPQMKKKEAPAELTPSEREEMIRLKAENEYLKAENEVIKKRIALRRERWDEELKAKKQKSSMVSAKKDMP